VRVEAVNVMAMDYGTGPADLVDRATAVAAATKGVVQELWPRTADDAAWRRVAVTPMIGVNDVAAEVFRPADAERLAGWARERGLAWLSFGSLNRDRPCDDAPAHPAARDDCSGVPQSPGDFTKLLAGRAAGG
jgi:chitinase